MKPDKKLLELDETIRTFQILTEMYPKAGYNESLAKLIQQRTNYVNRIGIKKK